MLEVVLVTKTQVDWGSFLTTAREFLGRSVSRGLDSSRASMSEAAAYVTALAELEREGSVNSLRDAGALLRQVHYGFLVRADLDVIFNIATTSSLKVVGTEKCAVVSGNLEEWRMAVINGCTERSSHSLRLFYDKCLLLFEADGLSQVWSEYQKVSQADRTFKLLEK